MRISILGCGWLGLPLAANLIVQGNEINGSTTTKSKLENLKKMGIVPFEIQLSENEIRGNISKFLGNAEVLIIAIPPKLRGINKENFVKKIYNLVEYIENSTVKKVIFISSTAVYEETNPINEVSEKTILNPKEENGKQLLISEQLLQHNNNNFKTTILRFGGLIDKNRNPIHFLAGKKNIENPEAPVNLIHKEDCIAIISELLKKENNNKWGEIFNAVADEHPTRKTYYTQKAIKNAIEQPVFSTEQSKGKKISNEKLKMQLQYTFIKSIFD
jgi:nucleoside-diphosphate-sugar epimerase